MQNNVEIILTDNGYWINLDKTCCVPLTQRGEVAYFKTKEQAERALSDNEHFINKMLLLTEENTL